MYNVLYIPGADQFLAKKPPVFLGGGILPPPPFRNCTTVPVWDLVLLEGGLNAQRQNLLHRRLLFDSENTLVADENSSQKDI